MVAINVLSADDAIREFRAAARDTEYPDVESVIVGEWASKHVHIPVGVNSEITSPFLDAYSELQDDLYRLVALIAYGRADIRLLSQEDLDIFLLKIKVTEGSSNYLDNVPEVVTKIAERMIGKMDGRQIVIALLGLGLLASGAWGASAYLEMRKQIRLEEIRSEERRAAIEALEFANEQQVAVFQEVLNIMKQNGAYSSRAADVAINSQDRILGAASKTDQTEINGNHVSRAEAFELRGSPRRSSHKKIIFQEMRVVDVNTSESTQTTIILEDPETNEQHRVTFRDTMLDSQKRSVVFDVLKTRDTAWFKLVVKEVGGEAVSVEILDVSADEPES